MTLSQAVAAGIRELNERGLANTPANCTHVAKLVLRADGERRPPASLWAPLANLIHSTAAERPECEGHPAGAYDPMGEIVYCDGACRAEAK